LDYIVETRNLSYSFGSFQALKDVSLKIEPGAIYGFVGPNGAGKTTTIRTLLGLYPVNNDNVFLFGKDMKNNKLENLKRIGAMVETPAHYEHLSAKENLEIARRIHGVEKKRINDVLDTVGLLKVADKRVSKYSLGMKQRLGLAWALLANPQMLILDEPTNGLDPHGIREIRELLFHLNKEKGVTILVSSHILSELEKLVTDVGIINKGELVFQGPISELLEFSVSKLVIDTDEPEKLMNLLAMKNFSPEKEGECSIKIKVKNKDEIIGLTKNLVKNEIPFYGLRNEQKTFEDIFFDIMKN